MKNFSELHQRALSTVANLRRNEAELISILSAIDHSQGFRELGYTSSFAYATRALRLSEAYSYQLITVARKSRRVPELHAGIAAGEITLSKAKSIAAVINQENQDHWLALARNVSTRELEIAVAATRPTPLPYEKVRHEGGNQVRLELTLPLEVYEKIQRIQVLLEGASLAETLKAVTELYLQRNDPVEKAERNHHRRSTLHVKSRHRHEIHRRDRGRCQFRLPDGKICGSSRWIHLHHIKPRAEGGEDSLKNIISLCSAHHRMVHKAESSPAKKQAIGSGGRGS